MHLRFRPRIPELGENAFLLLYLSHLDYRVFVIAAVVINIQFTLEEAFWY